MLSAMRTLDTNRLLDRRFLDLESTKEKPLPTSSELDTPLPVLAQESLQKPGLRLYLARVLNISELN